MSNPKQLKYFSKQKTETIKTSSKPKHPLYQANKQNIVVDHIKKDKPKTSKNITTAYHTKNVDQFEEETQSRKKLKTEHVEYRHLPQSIKNKHSFNITMGNRKQQKNEFLLTADLTTMNGFSKQPKISTMQSSKPKKQMTMTEEDINKLFDSKGCIQNKISGRNFKIDHLKKLLEVEDTFYNQNSNKGFRKDYADSIKFLELNDYDDKFLSALNEDNMVKVSPQKNIDKTAKFKENFIVGKQIGQGAYASVRVAICASLNKKIAIKIYEKKKIKQPQRKKSVRREIKILQQLQHTNIVKIYDVVQTNNHINLIMQYVPGVSLAAFLKNQPDNKLSQKQAKKLFHQIVQAVVYLHNINICHRDIKLQNVLLDYQLSPKLIDFGFATCIEDDKKVKMYCGTPSFMAPEIVSKNEYRGSPADIWALGVLLFVLVTGVFPFRGLTDKQLYSKICNVEHPSIDHLSSSLQNLLKKMLIAEPSQRITSFQILKHEWISKTPCQSQEKRSSTNMVQEKAFNRNTDKMRTQQSKQRKQFILTENNFKMREILQKANQRLSPGVDDLRIQTPTMIDRLLVNLTRQKEVGTPSGKQKLSRSNGCVRLGQGVRKLTNKIYF